MEGAMGRLSMCLRFFSFLTGSSLLAVWFLAHTSALAETVKGSRSVATRTAACKADCRAGNTHGFYRPYNVADPNFISPEGRKMYAECVRLCLAPLPISYFQKPIIEAGLPWFGKYKSDCLDCHAKGNPSRTASKSTEHSTGVIMLPEFLKRGP